jgi:uncharacterized protein with ParB-like and HNH nuclease domain
MGGRMNNDLKNISVSELFHSANYLIPIYQRNYAWDIDSSIDKNGKNYFLGNLIVNQRNNNVYEVIDGQQRLTTLYLLDIYLGVSLPQEALRFEAREKSNSTLSYISNSNNSELIGELTSPEILNGFRIIENCFKNKDINEKNRYVQKLKQVFLIQVQVPKNTNLNHYFEIMNTRGEQLELHEIAKAKLLEVLETDLDKNIAAMIWEKCSNMNSYIQMNFDVKVRNIIFSEQWSSLNESIFDFDCLKDNIKQQNESIIFGKFESFDKKSLKEILENNYINDIKPLTDGEENERFESTLSFPNFLLQVNAAMRKIGEEDSKLDDKYFLTNLSWAWSNSKNSKDFMFCLLKCRVLFDKYVIKREFARDYKESGKWSLQRLEKYYGQNNNSAKPKYVGTFGDENKETKKIRTLQSCLRITYTSPKTMYWITIILSNFLKNDKTDTIFLLEEYCKKKIGNSGYKSKNGFGIERIIFAYLDYLIYRDGYSYNEEKIILPLSDDWQFLFRSSIEHFHPQNPVEVEEWNKEDLNGFGNLALITVSGNSKFSNLPPDGKINSYPSIINQSLKLKIMEKMTRKGEGKWTKEKAFKHKSEMFKILSS